MRNSTSTLLLLAFFLADCKSFKTAPKNDKDLSEAKEKEMHIEEEELPQIIELNSTAGSQDLHGDTLPEGAVYRLGSLRMFDRSIRTISFSQDGSTLISNGGDHVGIWDLATVKKMRTIPKASMVTFLLPLSDSKNVVVATEQDNLVEIIDTKTGSKTAIDIPNESPILSGCEFPDGNIVLGDKKGGLHSWNQEKNSHSLIATSKASITSVNCDHSDFIVWGDAHGNVFTNKSKKITKMGTSKSPVVELAVSSAGKVAAGDANGNITYWKQITSPPKVVEGHARITQSLCFLNEQSFISSGGDDVFRVWQTGSLDMLEERLTNTGLDSQHFACSKDKNFMVSWSGHANEKGSESGRFWLWTTKDGNPLIEPERHNEGITKVVATKQKSILTSSKDGSVKAWTTTNGELKKTWSFDGDPINDLIMKEQTKGILWAASKNAKVFEIATTKLQNEYTLNYAGGELNKLVYSSKWKRLFTGDRTGRLWSWDVPSGTKIQAYDQSEFSSIESLALSPLENLLAVSGSGNKVLVFDLESGKTVAKLDTKNSMTNYALAFSHQGHELAVGGEDMQVHVWDTTSWKLKRTLKGHDGTVRALQYSQDDKHLASGGHDEWLIVWDMQTGTLLKKHEGHKDIITDLTWLPDQKHIATVSEDKTGLVWRFP